MKVKTIASSWITHEGRRLDCGPFMSGVLEARMVLAQLPCRKDRLADVCVPDGIFMPGRFKRIYVDDPEHGLPWLSPSEMQRADLSGLSYVSKVHTPALDSLRIHRNYILLTRSGTIGNLVFARPDMEGLIGSDDIIRIVAEPDKILPGYLYAFLSSHLGRSLIQQNTYGAIIPHLEPHHIADLPVPRLGDAVEQRVHDLVEEAARSRSEAVALRRSARQTMQEVFSLHDQNLIGVNTYFVATVQSSELRRLDATYFNPAGVYAADQLAAAGDHQHQLSEVCEVFTPGIFKRIHVEEPEYGYAYFSGSELFQIAPTPRGYLSRRAPNISDYIVHEDWLLIQDAGQLGGLIGQITRVPQTLNEVVVSNHLIRVVPRSRIDAGYLFALLGSPLGHHAITRNAFGSSIPQLDPAQVGSIMIPWPSEHYRMNISRPVLQSWDLEDRATSAELEAVSIVEQAIEGAA